jgi:hypothetical protein
MLPGTGQGLITSTSKNIKIIYFHVKNAYLAQRKRLFCPGNGERETLDFLVEHFSFLGFDGQYWMLIAVGVIAFFIFLARSRHSGA